MTVLLWSILAVLVAWLVLQRRTLRRLGESLDTARREIYGVQYEMYEKVHRLDAALTATRLELRAQAGEFRVAPSARITDVIRLHPRVKDVLESFGVGGGAGILTDSTETLQQAAVTYGQDLEAMLTELTRMLNDPGGWRPSGGGASAPIQIQSLGSFSV